MAVVLDASVKPCPCCGGKAKVISLAYASVECTNCHLRTTSYYFATGLGDEEAVTAALAAWNQRTST
jgi:hypothetical protein